MAQLLESMSLMIKCVKAEILKTWESHTLHKDQKSLELLWDAAKWVLITFLEIYSNLPSVVLNANKLFQMQISRAFL